MVISPVAVSLKKGNKKKSKLIEVEYHKLFEEVDGSKRLKEKVPVRCVRPSPPLEEGLEGFGKRRRRVFPGFLVDRCRGTPPDEREFEVLELRVHWDWINRSWVRPHRQDITNPTSEGGVHEQLTFENPNASVSTVPVNNLGDDKDPCSGKASDQVDGSPGFQKTPHVRNHVTKKRGRTRKTPIKSIETLATDNLNEKDDDPRIIPEVEAIVMETLQVPNQEKTTH